MKKLIFIPVIILFVSVFFACEPIQENTPDAFQDKSVVSDLSSMKRGYSDLISTLYAEILEKNKELQVLEDSLKNLKEETFDKTEDANTYFSNIQKFYDAAYTYVELIQDSILREKIFEELGENENTFNNTSQKLAKLLGKISQKQAELNDAHYALKILLTMKQNEDYQMNNLPDTASVYGLKEKYDTIINLIQEKIKK